MAEPRVLKLQSPAYGDPIFYKWPLVVTKRLDEPSEIAETIRLVCEDFPELKYAVENVILKDYDANDYDSMNQLCQRYNKAMKNILQLWKGRAPPPRMFQPPNKELLRHIINLCYGHAIQEPEKLNLYEPFSPEVYGETSFDMVAQILEEIQVSSDQTFLDLGSGVGQVVLQAASSSRFKECIGVEKSETPAAYAKKMEIEFKKWMDWFGKTYTDFTLEKGDFMDDKWRDVINDCGVVFVNNFAFGPVVNHHLKTRFQTMKEGSKVVSSREFVPMNFKFNKRNLSELGAMIRVSEIKPKGEQATVSWTGNSVSYFLHVVDRTRLEKYFSILKKKKDGQDLDEDEMSLCSETTNSVDSNGTPVDIERLEENLDDLYLGTTTRHQWQLLTDTINQSKQDGGKVMPGREAKTRGRIKQTQQVLIKQQSIIQKSAKLQMKNKILQKYGHQKVKKKPILPREDSVDSSDSPDPSIPKTKYLKTNKKINVDLLKKKKVNGNSIKDVKNKPLLKLRRGRKPIKEKSPPESSDWKPSSVEGSESDEPDVKPVPEAKVPSPLRTVKKESKPQKENLEEEVDKYLACMKMKYLEFIKRINTKEYAERLKVMIECETAKKKLLSQEINETERMVQNLISDSLRNFSSRLVELDLAVKTPLDLLSKSSVLAQKHRDLESKVVNMEIEVLNLEEKYKILCAARNQKNRKLGLEPMIDSDSEEISQDPAKPDRKKEMETKLCGAILNALNHRRTLMDQQSSLSEQISILEKISHTDAQNREGSAELEEREPIKIEDKVNRPKAKPVALVPPRMLSDNKKNTISPETMGDSSLHPGNDPNRSRRGRRRKRSAKAAEEQTRSSSAQSDSSQDSKTELDERIPPAATIRNRTSTALNGATTTTLSQQISSTDQRYISYQAQEQRAPITFPRNAANSLASDNMKNTKQFLKTSGKLLNAAPSKWGSFQETQTTSRMRRTSNSESEPFNQVISNVMNDISEKNISLQLYEKDKWNKQPSLPRVSSNEMKGCASGDTLHTVSNNFSLPINSLVMSTSSQLDTSLQTNLATTSYLKLISDNECLNPQDVSMSVPLNLCKSSTEPSYVSALSTACTTIDEDVLSSSCATSQPAAAITVKLLPNISHLETKNMERRHGSDQKEFGMDDAFTRHSSSSPQNLLQSSSGSINRKSTSVWTSSTFSVTQLQTPETSKKTLNNTMLNVSQADNSKGLASSSSPPKNRNPINIVINSTHSPPTSTLPIVNNHEPIGMPSNNDEMQVLNNFFPLSTRPPSYDMQATNNASQSKNEGDKPAAKKKKGRPKAATKKGAEVTHGKGMNDRYHYPFAMLPESITSGRCTPMSDTGIKRKIDESFHRQYPNPDVDDHFRTSFNKLCQDANREAALNTLQETVKSVKTSPQASSVSIFNANIANQGPSYRACHNFMPPPNENSANVVNTSGPPTVNDKGSMIPFVSDKPIPYPRSHKDLPECQARSRDHRIGGPPVPASIPMYDKNVVSMGSESYSFSQGGSSTPLYCPSTMKLLKSNFEGSKGPPVTLLIPAKGNPNEVPSYSKMAVFPSPTSKVSQGAPPIVHQDVGNNPRDPRKPNPDMFLNSFPGGSFIPPSVPGGAHSTFIPGGIQESKCRPANDMMLRPPPTMGIRGRKPKNTGKKMCVPNSLGISDPGSHIDFAKCPTNNTSVPVMNTNNLINAGFRPPIIRNPMHPIQNLPSLSLDVRSRIRPRILNSQLHPTVVNRLLVPRSPRPDATKGHASPASMFQHRTPHPMDAAGKQKTPSPGSPTYNNPRFVLLNMGVPRGSTSDSDSGHGPHRQHSMTSATSPTFPPPNS